jgi:hypothetical protein
MPVTYIVPSGVVANALSQSHQAWLAKPGRGGRPHRDHDMRRIQPVFNHDLAEFPPGWMNEYKEAWDLLKEAVGTS